jgi:hypothetical protein
VSSIRVRAYLTIALSVVAALCVAGGAVAWESRVQKQDDGRPNDPTAYTRKTTDIPQSDDPQAAVEATLAGLDTSAFANIHIGTPPSREDWPGLWLYATVQDDSAGDGSLHSIWEADVAQGIIADRLAAGSSNLADVVSGSSIEVRADDGSSSPVTGGAGDIQTGQLFDASGLSDDEIENAIRVTLQQYGLTATSINVLHPLGPAVSVIATVPDAKDLSDFTIMQMALVGKPVQYEGLYIEVDLPDGSPVVRSTAAYRSGAGRLWIAPGYEDVVGVGHGGPPTR